MSNIRTKNVDETVSYSFDWSSYLGTDTISSYVVTVESGLTHIGDLEAAGIITVGVSGGTAGETYEIVCEIVTSSAAEYSDILYIQVLAAPIISTSLDYATGFPVVKTKTLLSIDRYAEIVGVNPVFFNQGAQINLPDGSALFPHGSGTPNIELTWQQHSWDVRNNVSREELAYEINRAEHEISKFLGYWPSPKWTEEELVDMPMHYDPYIGNVSIDLRGDYSGIRIKKRKFIAGGRRAVSFLGNVCIDYVDEDGDGWSETAQIVINTGTTSFNKHEYKVYLANNGGNEIYEIRPAKVKYANGSVLTMKFDSWKFIDPELKHAHTTNDTNSVNIDISNMSNLVTTVDVYREYNDTTQVSAQLIYDDETTEDGSLVLKNAKADFVSIVPASGCTSFCCGKPQFVKLWYYSGNKCPESENVWGDYMDGILARCIAMIATARLERPLAGNINVTAFSQKMQIDMTTGEGRQYRYADPILYQNPFGTKYGEFVAYKTLMSFDKRW
jgi:hypothetical protein